MNFFALTDHKKLPFMAMLRNLKNMITAGLKEKHHNLVLHRLTDEVCFFVVNCTSKFQKELSIKNLFILNKFNELPQFTYMLSINS